MRFVVVVVGACPAALIVGGLVVVVLGACPAALTVIGLIAVDLAQIDVGRAGIAGVVHDAGGSAAGGVDLAVDRADRLRDVNRVAVLKDDADLAQRIVIGGAAHGAVARLRRGDIAADIAVGHVLAVPEYRGGRAVVEVALNVAQAVGDGDGDLALHLDRHGVVGPVGDRAGVGAAGRGLGLLLRRDVHVGRGGAGGLSLVVEGAVRAPVVHVLLHVGNAERGAVFTAHACPREDVAEVRGGILAAVGGDQRPAERLKGVGAGDKHRGLTLALVLVGGVLRNAEVDRCDGRGRRGGRGRIHGRRGRCGRIDGRRGCRGLRQGVRLRNREALGRALSAGEHRKAVRQAGEALRVTGPEPVEAGVASLTGGEGVYTGGVVLLRGDGHAVGVRVGDGSRPVFHHRMLDGVGHVGHDAVLHAVGALAGVDLVFGEHHIVIEHIVPGVARDVVIGVGAVGEDIGEGLIRVLGKGALRQGFAVLADLPDLQVGGAVLGMLGRGDELHLPVAVEVCDGVVPGLGAVGLLEGVQLRENQLELCVDIRFFREGCQRRADSQGEQHGRRQQKAEKVFLFHGRILSCLFIYDAPKAFRGLSPRKAVFFMLRFQSQSFLYFRTLPFSASMLNSYSRPP